MAAKWLWGLGLAGILTACTSPSGDDTYIGWYCVDNASTGIKDCEKRLMRDGVPVNSVVYERLEGGQTALASQQAWRNGLPNLDNTPVTAVNSVDDPGLAVTDRGPAPQPVKAFVSWADEGLGEGERRALLGAPGEAVRDPSASQPAPTRAPVVEQAKLDALPKGFTIQLGAFRKDDQCYALMATFADSEHSTRVRHINSNGQRYCIVTYGDFDSLDGASQAGATLTAEREELDTWVRSWASIANAAAE